MGGLGSSSKFWTGNRYGLEPLHQCGKRLKLKVRKSWGLTPKFVEVTGEKLILGGGLSGHPHPE